MAFKDFLPLIGTGISAVSSLFGQNMQSQNVREQLKVQQQENALNREFNSQQAQLNRDFQRSMWDAYNAYNSPSAQMQRFREAGLNPNLIYGSLNQSVGSTQPGSAASYSSGISPVSLDTSNLSNLGATAESALQNVANYNKTKAEASITATRAQYEEAAIQNSITLGKLQIIDLQNYNDLNPLRKDKMAAELNVFSQTANKLMAEIDSINADILIKNQDLILKELETAFASASFEDRLRKIAAEADISETEARYKAKCIAATIAAQYAGVELSKLQGEYYSAVSEGQRLMNKSTGEFNRLNLDILKVEKNTMLLNYGRLSAGQAAAEALATTKEFMGIIGSAFGAVNPIVARGQF